MSSMCDWNKEQTLKLVQHYRDIQSLWDSRHSDRKNRIYQQDNYEKLVDLMKESQPEVDVESIKKKSRT